jgi:hypothetical protein
MAMPYHHTQRGLQPEEQEMPFFPSSEQTETMRVALDLACGELGLREADDKLG